MLPKQFGYAAQQDRTNNLDMLHKQFGYAAQQDCTNNRNILCDGA
jgi:hypothetical protein